MIAWAIAIPLGPAAEVQWNPFHSGFFGIGFSPRLLNAKAISDDSGSLVASEGSVIDLKSRGFPPMMIREIDRSVNAHLNLSCVGSSLIDRLNHKGKTFGRPSILDNGAPTEPLNG